MSLFPTIIGFRGERQTRYPIQMDQGRVGQIITGIRTESAFVSGQDVAEVRTLTIATGSGNYTATLEGETTATVAFDTDDTTTATALRDALRDLNAAANFTITSAAGVITITSRFTGAAFTLSATGNNITAAVGTAAVASSPITLGTLVRIANGSSRQTALPASAGDRNWGIACNSSLAELNYFTASDNGLFLIERGKQFTVTREGTCFALFEVAGTPATGIRYRDTADGALDTIGALNPSAGTGLTQPTDLTISLLEPTFDLNNGFYGGHVEIAL